MFLGFAYQSCDGLVDKPSWSSLSFKRKEKAELLICNKARREGDHSSVRSFSGSASLLLPCPYCSFLLAVLFKQGYLKNCACESSQESAWDWAGKDRVTFNSGRSWWCYSYHPCDEESCSPRPNGGARWLYWAGIPKTGLVTKAVLHLSHDLVVFLLCPNTRSCVRRVKWKILVYFQRGFFQRQLVVPKPDCFYLFRQVKACK